MEITHKVHHLTPYYPILDLNLISEAEEHFRNTLPTNLWDGDASPELKSKMGYGLLKTNLSNDFLKRHFLQSQPYVAPRHPSKSKNLSKNQPQKPEFSSRSMQYEHGSDVFTNGDSYIGKYQNGLRNGYGHYTWKNGNYYVGEFKDGLKHGYGFWSKSKEPHANNYTGEFINDKK